MGDAQNDAKLYELARAAGYREGVEAAAKACEANAGVWAPWRDAARSCAGVVRALLDKPAPATSDPVLGDKMGKTTLPPNKPVPATAECTCRWTIDSHGVNTWRMSATCPVHARAVRCNGRCIHAIPGPMTVDPECPLHAPSAPKPACPTCGGAGYVGDRWLQSKRQCPDCGGGR